MKKGQFFIATTIMIIIIISLISINLYIPNELNSIQSENNEEMFNNIKSSQELLKDLINYVKINWQLPFTNRIKLNIHTQHKIIDNTIYTPINVSENTYINSIVMKDEKNKNVPFNIEWKNKTQGVVYFEASINELSDKIYNLYYNKAPGRTIKNEIPQLINYTINNDIITIKTPNYNVLINTSNGGKFNWLNYSSSHLINSFNSFIKCGQVYWINDSANKDFKITNKNYYLRITFSGSNFDNETHIITELFFPDKIIINTNLKIARDSFCSDWGTEIKFNKSILMNYYDNTGLTQEPLNSSSLTYTGKNKWCEHYGNISIGILPGNESPHYYQTNNEESISRYNFINNTSIIKKGEYINNITIIPSLNRINTTITPQPTISKNYENINDFINNIFSLIDNYFTEKNFILTHTENMLINHQYFHNTTNWEDNYERKDKFLVSGPNTLTPVEVNLLLNNYPVSITLDKEGILPTQISTDNYHLSSSFENYLNNSIINNSFLLFNPNGKDFNITIIKNGLLSAKLIYPNNTINYYNLNTSPYTINIYTNLSGFYKIIFNGSALYKLNTTLPKLIGLLPIELMNGSPIYLFVNKSIENISLSIKTFSTNTQTFTLFDEFNNTLKTITRSSPGTSNISEKVVPCINGCIYKLEINNNSPFILNSSLDFVSTNKKYLINPLEPKLTLITTTTLNSPEEMNAYYNLSSYPNKIKKSDLNYSENEKWVSNAFYNFSFNNGLIYNRTNWGKWLTCTNTCSEVFDDIQFIEKGSERVVVNATSNNVNYLFFFYPNISYFKVKTYYNQNYKFGPQWKINGTNDKYVFYNSKEIPINNDVVINKNNLTGPTTYFGKKDDFMSASVILNTNTLMMNDSLKLNQSSIIINSFGNGNYIFLLNIDPVEYVNPITIKQQTLIINYNYSSDNTKVKGSTT